MKYARFIPGIALVLSFITINVQAQNVGINTTTPQRDLEVAGAADEYIRIQTTTTTNAEASLELIVGTPLSGARDFKIGNDAGYFKIMTSTDNFEAVHEDIWLIDPVGQVGMGTTSPAARLHIDGGEEGSNTGDGYMLLGSKTGANMIIDQNEIIARNNGNAATMTLQSHDGDTHIGNGGGNTSLCAGGGNVGIGTSSPSSELSIVNNDLQLALRNTVGNVDWYIGASNDDWSIGDDHLIFTPDQTSESAVLRLLDVSENNGVTAPVMIHSNASHVLLIDGNEIDTKSEALYINHNSDQETYINPSGGRVGIGNDSPTSTLHITTQGEERALRFQRGSIAWEIDPVPAGDFLGFVKDGWTVGHIDGGSGQWVTISDRRFKDDIRELPDMLDKLSRLNVYSYSFKNADTPLRQYGLFAQELITEFPEAVHEQDGTYTVGYSKLSVVLLKALQEQQREIDTLQQELDALIASMK